MGDATPKPDKGDEKQPAEEQQAEEKPKPGAYKEQGRTFSGKGVERQK